MKLFLKFIGLVVASAAIGWAQTELPQASFLQSLSAAERQAIGIDAMSPAQLTALEAAVERYRNREVEKSTEVAVAAAVETVRAEQAKAEPEEAGPSLLERAKVLLSPGTEIEYARVETTLTEPFKGWKKGQLFRLANGQTWRVVEGNYWAAAEPAGKAVSIEPGTFGSFFLKFEGISKRARAEPVLR